VLVPVLVLALVRELVLVQELVPVPVQELVMHTQPGCLPASLLILMLILVFFSIHPPCLNFYCETV